jgi:hypothetical protein
MLMKLIFSYTKLELKLKYFFISSTTPSANFLALCSRKLGTLQRYQDSGTVKKKL